MKTETSPEKPSLLTTASAVASILSLYLGVYFASTSSPGTDGAQWLLWAATIFAFVVIALAIEEYRKRSLARPTNAWRELVGLATNQLTVQEGGVLEFPHIVVLRDKHDLNMDSLFQDHLMPLIPGGSHSEIARKTSNFVTVLDINEVGLEGGVEATVSKAEALVVVRSVKIPTGWGNIVAYINKWAKKRSALPAVAILIDGANIPSGLEWMPAEKASLEHLGLSLRAIIPGLLGRASRRSIRWRERARTLYYVLVLLSFFALCLVIAFGLSQKRRQALEDGLDTGKMGQLLRGIEAVHGSESFSDIVVDEQANAWLSAAVVAEIKLLDGSKPGESDGLSFWSAFDYKSSKVIGELVTTPRKPVGPSCFELSMARALGDPAVVVSKAGSLVECAAANEWVIVGKRNSDLQLVELRATNLKGEDVLQKHLEMACDYHDLQKGPPPEPAVSSGRDPEEWSWRGLICVPLGEDRSRALCATFEKDSVVDFKRNAQVVVELASWLSRVELPAMSERLEERCEQTLEAGKTEAGE